MKTWLLNILFVVMLLWLNDRRCEHAMLVSFFIPSGCQVTPSGPSSNA